MEKNEKKHWKKMKKNQFLILMLVSGLHITIVLVLYHSNLVAKHLNTKTYSYIS